jgi:uncharacterized protein (DUF2267 family)
MATDTCAGYVENDTKCEGTIEHPYIYCDAHLEDHQDASMATSKALRARRVYKIAIEEANALMAKLQRELAGLSDADMDDFTRMQERF